MKRRPRIYAYDRMFVAKAYMLSHSLTEWELEGMEIVSVERTPDLQTPYEVIVRREMTASELRNWKRNNKVRA